MDILCHNTSKKLNHCIVQFQTVHFTSFNIKSQEKKNTLESSSSFSRPRTVFSELICLRGFNLKTLKSCTCCDVVNHARRKNSGMICYLLFPVLWWLSPSAKSVLKAITYRDRCLSKPQPTLRAVFVGADKWVWPLTIK